MRHRLPLIIALLIAGCATPPAAPPPPPVGDAGKAVIIAVRPIAPAATILATIGTTAGTPATEADPAAGSKREFILRTEDGRIVSIVQDNGGDRLQPGQSVSIIGGDHAHLSDGS